MPSFDFDAKEVEDAVSEGFSVVPPGWYSAMVIKSELKETKAGDGRYFNLTFSILGPSHEKRIVFQMYNVENKNPVAVRISKSQLKALSLAAGVPAWTASEELHMIPIGIKVNVKPAKGNWEESNGVVDYCSEETLADVIEDAAKKHDEMVAPAAPWKGDAPVVADDESVPF